MTEGERTDLVLAALDAAEMGDIARLARLEEQLRPLLEDGEMRTAHEVVVDALRYLAPAEAAE